MNVRTAHRDKKQANKQTSKNKKTTTKKKPKKGGGGTFVEIRSRDWCGERAAEVEPGGARSPEPGEPGVESGRLAHSVG